MAQLTGTARVLRRGRNRRKPARRLPRRRRVRARSAPGGGEAAGLQRDRVRRRPPRPARLQIFTPAVELPFAGHPLVGTAWLLAQHGARARHAAAARGRGARAGGGRPRLRGGPPRVAARLRTGSSSARPRRSRRWTGRRRASATWRARTRRSTTTRVRARVFPVALGIPEDEATGSAAVRLGALLGRPMRIHQGRGLGDRRGAARGRLRGDRRPGDDRPGASTIRRRAAPPRRPRSRRC